MSYIKSTRIVENTWVCSSCQNKNLGRFMKCQKCGSVKEKDEEDIVPEPGVAETVSDSELLKLANAGPNWVCEYCKGQTRDAQGKCVNCAAPKEEPKPEKVVVTSSPTLTLWTEPGWDRVKEAAKKLDEAEKEQKARFKRDWKPYITAGSVAGGVILLAGLFYWLFTPKEVVAKVSSTTWKFTSVLYQKTLQHGSDWGTPPFNSFNVSCMTRLYGQENCHPHQCRAHSEFYECSCHNVEYGCHERCSSRKNGFSSCQTVCDTRKECSTCDRTVYDTCYDSCPVYRDWCEYSYYGWPEVDRKVTSGTTSNVYWPSLEAGVDQKLETSETYKVVFTREEGSWEYSPPNLQAFSKFTTGDSWKVRVRRAGVMTEPLEEVR